MIFVKNTPNNAGVAVYGDCKDIEALYESLHNIVGADDEFLPHDSARTRVLGFCYDLRHALMGDREIEFVENGMNADKMRYMSTIASDKNVYLKINVLWPEMLFVTMALNDFVRLYGRKRAKSQYEFILDKQNIWDESIATVRLFQAALANCIKETVSEASFRRMMSLMTKDYTVLEHYADQYVDLLNCRFLALGKDKRLKNIPIICKRLAEQDDEYKQVKNEVMAAAKEYNYPVGDIKLKMEYPDDIEW